MNNTYEGDPIDVSYTHLAELEAPGEDANASGDNTTTFGENTSLQSKICELDMMNPSITTREIAAMLGCDHSYVSEVLRRASEGKYGRHRKDSWEDYTDSEKMILKLERSGICKTRAEIADRVGVSGAFVTKVLEANSHIVD